MMKPVLDSFAPNLRILIAGGAPMSKDAIKGFLDLGIILFSFSLIFQLITLPVEFNASSRALRILDESGMLYDDELRGAKKVLSAAAMTYVAAAIATLLSLLRLIILFGGRRRND